MTTRTGLCWSVLMVTVCVPAAAGGERSPAPEMVKTIDAVRDVGTAMFSWHRYEFGQRDYDGSEQEVDVSGVPLIAPEALEELLVPEYLPALPRQDGWGHELEFRLVREARGSQLMSVRSAGADGQLAGPVYEIGGFPPEDAGADLVWIDGFFARWPQAAEE